MTTDQQRTVGIAFQDSATRLDLPGRQWGLLLGPGNVGAANSYSWTVDTIAPTVTMTVTPLPASAVMRVARRNAPS